MDVSISPERKLILDQLYDAFAVVSEGSYLYLCDMKYDLSRWSPEAVEFFGLPGEYMEHAGVIWEEHIFPEDRQSYSASIGAIFSGREQAHDMQYRARDRQGRYVVCTCRGTVLRAPDGTLDYFAGIIQNHGLVNSIDPLTGLQNQYGLFSHLSVLFRKKSKSNIMMLGISQFAVINEMWGYDFGNLVIHKLVQLLKETFRNEGILYRVDGVRFVLLTRTLSMDQLSEQFARLKTRLHSHLEVDGCRLNLRLWGSAMELTAFDINPQAMYSCLGYAFHQAKEQNFQELNVFHSGVDKGRGDLLALINTVRRSIEQDCAGFLLYYQPIVNAQTSRIIGGEALLRWQNEEYGMVPPNRFIPIIENDPSFVQLGEWILRRAMEDTRPMLPLCPDFQLNVNIAYEQIQQDSFVDMVKGVLDETGFPPRNLCLEITERCRLMNTDRLAAILEELRPLGVRFAMDDFGTGYSSMDILNRLDCEVVKIDKVFVDEITTDSCKNARLIGVMNELADICGSKVCVEGVETVEQCEILRRCGVHSIQGYYFSKPVPAEEFRGKFA